MDPYLPRVLEVVRTLALECGGPRAFQAVTPEASLVRDVGLDSLEQVELRVRLEAAFGVELPDDTLSLDTPAGLARAVGDAHAAAPVAPPDVVAPVPGPGIQRAEGADTLHGALVKWADAETMRPHAYLRQDDGSFTILTYGELGQGAAALASGIRSRGIQRGEAVALMLPTGGDFLRAFMGILLAGADLDKNIACVPDAAGEDVLEVTADDVRVTHPKEGSDGLPHEPPPLDCEESGGGAVGLSDPARTIQLEIANGRDGVELGVPAVALLDVELRSPKLPTQLLDLVPEPLHIARTRVPAFRGRGPNEPHSRIRSVQRARAATFGPFFRPVGWFRALVGAARQLLGPGVALRSSRSGEVVCRCHGGPPFPSRSG
ncbi:MAG: phosphopantetheine-binding protein [Gemmatimonadota bacterium]